MNKSKITLKTKELDEKLSYDDKRIFRENVEEFTKSKGLDFNNYSDDVRFKLVGKMIKGCKKCPIAYKRDAVILPKYNRNPKILFISRSSGSQEIQENSILPVTYPAGLLFEKYITSLGLSRSDIYLTNLVFCSCKKTYPPEPRTILRCEHWKDLELDCINIPDVIVLMGNDAFRYFYGDRAPSVLSILGDLYVTEFRGKKRLVVPILHPVNVLRESEYGKSVELILKVVGKMMESGLDDILG